MAMVDISRIRLGLAQVNPTVGDVAGNSLLILQYLQEAAEHQVDVVLFPEMVLTGYPIEDLALRATFRQASTSALENLARTIADRGFGEIIALVGYLDENPRGQALNSVAFLHRGQVIARYAKRHLPNYGVFDEYRNFASGSGSLLFRYRGADIAVAICEDIWHREGVIEDLIRRTPALLLVPNGSPYDRDKSDERSRLVKTRAREIGATIAYVNCVGGQDDLVFDGDSIVVDGAGAVITRAPQFDEGLLALDLDLPTHSSDGHGGVDLVISEEMVMASDLPARIPGVATPLGDLEGVWRALTLGLRDYVEKNGFSSVILGLSGGIDSAVTAVLAVDALGAERVYGVAMPSKFSSSHSREDAEDLAIRNGIHFRTEMIEEMVEPVRHQLALTGLADENLQARIRGLTLMALSNQEGHLVLATGNKSELAVGYSTLYGDAVGGYAPIKDLFKVDVWALARWRNAEATSLGVQPPIPERSITKEPSAELRPGQRDTDSLPDYEILDRLLKIYIEEDGGLAGLLAAGIDRELAERVIQMVDRAEYKRRQYPPGPKVSRRAFGKERRLPMTSRWREGKN